LAQALRFLGAEKVDVEMKLRFLIVARLVVRSACIMITIVYSLGVETAIAQTPIAETRTVNTGQSFVVSLPLQSGTGTRWELMSAEKFQILSNQRRSGNTAPGSTVQQVFSLKATETGSFLLVWQLVRPGSSPYREYRVRVQVE
jgi:predicted secreted protein